jgi:quercetin dioxygenase-like cupin family protein
MRYALFACMLLAAMATMSCTADSTEATTAEVKSEMLVRTDTTANGQPIVMPEYPVLVTTIATFPPGARVPVHKHAYPHYGYFLEGELTVTNEETGKSIVLKKGDFYVEVNNTWHSGRNQGGVPVRVLTIEHLPKGVTSNRVLRDAR